MTQVSLVDLEVILRYSLAVGQEHAPAQEVLEALDASRAHVLAQLTPEEVAAYAPVATVVTTPVTGAPADLLPLAEPADEPAEPAEPSEGVAEEDGWTAFVAADPEAGAVGEQAARGARRSPRRARKA